MLRDHVLRFFEVVLPAIVRTRGALFDRTRGTLAVFVEGAGSWTVSFGDHQHQNAVARGASSDADCVVAFSLAAFVELLEGRSAAPPIHIGDLRLIESLGHLLVAPVRGALGAQLITSPSPRR